jgi:NitT/TauT family transport system substrate-binding protein
LHQIIYDNKKGELMERVASRFFQKVIIYLILFSIAVTSYGCTSAGSENTKIRIGYEANLSNYQFFVADELGYFEDEGLDVEIIKFNTTNEQTLALLAGQVDMIPNSSMALLLEAEAEHPGRFLIFSAHGDLGNKVLVKKDSGITSIDQIANLKLGTFPGTTMDTYSKMSLAPYFDSAHFPTIVPMQPPNLVEALASGQVDAIYIVEPFLSIAMQKIEVTELLDNPLGNILSPFTGGASVLHKGFADEHPEEAAAIVRAIEKATAYIREHDTEARDILAKYTGYEDGLFQSTIVGYIWNLDEIDKQSIQTLADVFAEAGIVEQQVDTSHWYYIGD